MDIHHAMMVRNSPERVYEALTRLRDMEAWWGASIIGGAEVGSTIDIQFDQGRRGLKFVILRLEEGRLVQWRVIQPVWPIEPVFDQVVTWTLEPFEDSTLVDFRMEGWPQDDGVYASVSYKWATYMFKLKVFAGDTREIEPILPVVEKLKGETV